MTNIQTLLRLGQGAMGAQQRRLGTVQNNIANAQTEGYRRQRTDLETLGGKHRQTMLGVTTGARRSITAPLTDHLVPGYRSELGEQRAMAQTASLAEQMMASSGTEDLSESLGKFFASARELEASPENRAARQSFLDHADRLAHHVSQSWDTLNQVKEQTRNSATLMVDGINQDLEALAQADKELQSNPGNLELRDARDAMVNRVADRIGVRPVQTKDGSLHLVSSSGAALVESGRAHPISISQGDPMEVRTAQGDRLQDVGGELGGALGAMEDILGGAMAKLDDFVTTFSGKINAIHQAATAQDGSTGRDLFEFDPAQPGGSFALAADLQGRPERLALAKSGVSAFGKNDALVEMLSLDEGAQIGAGEEFGSFLIGVSGGIGGAIQSAEVKMDRAEQALFGVESMQASISGVSLEEEMVSLTQAKQAFEASSRLVQVGNELMDTVLSLR